MRAHRSGAVLLFFLASVPALSFAAGDAGHRIAVISVGGDAAAAGDLERDIELRLTALPRVTLKIPGDSAPALNKGFSAPPTTPDAALEKEAADLLQKAKDAYYDDKAAVALDRLGALANLQERNGNFPVAERVGLLLWRTAVFLALKDQAQAESEALAALSLEPDLKVDVNEFRPSVKDLVEQVRTRGLHYVTVVVTGLPAGATVKIDDRPTPARFQVPIGRHHLSGSGPGRRDVQRYFDAPSDVSIPMTLPPAMDPSLDAALSAMVWRGQPGPSDVQLLSNLSQRLGADWLVVAAVRSDPAAESRVALISLSPGGPAFVSAQVANGPGANASLASWVDARVQSEVAAAPLVAATPVPISSTPPPDRHDRPHVGQPHVVAGPSTDVSARVGFLFLDDSRSVSGSGVTGHTGPTSYSTSFTGAGPRLTADVAHGSIIGELDVAYVSYAGSTDTVTPASGSGGPTKVNGGSSTFARLDGGWRHAFGAGDFDGSPVIRLSGGVAYENHTAQDVDSDGLLTSFSAVSLDLRADGAFPFPSSDLRPTLIGGLAVLPALSYAESPGGLSQGSGTSPSAGLQIMGHAGVALLPTDRLAIAAEIQGQTRSVSFKGTAAMGGLALTNTTVVDTIFGVGLTLRYRF